MLRTTACCNVFSGTVSPAKLFTGAGAFAGAGAGAGVAAPTGA